MFIFYSHVIFIFMINVCVWEREREGRKRKLSLVDPLNLDFLNAEPFHPAFECIFRWNVQPFARELSSFIDRSEMLDKKNSDPLLILIPWQWGAHTDHLGCLACSATSLVWIFSVHLSLECTWALSPVATDLLNVWSILKMAGTMSSAVCVLPSAV